MNTPRSLGSAIRTLALTGLGGILEGFDFIIFALFIPVISRLFFPPTIPEWVAQLQTFGIFAAGNLARPLGGIVLDHLGDKLGRKKTFTVSILLMAIATLGVAATPTYATLGVAAPLILLLLRLLQGAAMGGELPGAWTFVAEHVPQRRIGLAGGIMMSGLAIGNLLGALSAVIVNSYFQTGQIASFAWRFPFLAGGIFALIAVYLRRWLAETPVFEKMQRAGRLAPEVPLKIVLRSHRRAIVISMVLTWMVSAAIIVLFVMTPTLLQTHYHIAPRLALEANSIATANLAIGCIVGGMLADAVGSCLFFMLGAPLLATCTYVLYACLPMHQNVLFPLYGLAGLTCGVIAGVPVALVNCFPASVRFTGVAFSYNGSYALFSGLMPPLIAFGSRIDPLAPVYALGLGCFAAVVIGLILSIGRTLPELG